MTPTSDERYIATENTYTQQNYFIDTTDGIRKLAEREDGTIVGGMSEPTQALRDGLAARGVEWRDDSDVIDEADMRMRIERTRFELADGMTISCVWGWVAAEPTWNPMGITAGWPWGLEEWVPGGKEAPKAMEVDEVLGMIG